MQILTRRQKNNPCLIGEPGVGKTAIAEALAQRIAAGNVPYKLRDKEVHLVDLTALVAGTQFRGQFESRMKGLIDEVKALGNIILVIDEVHSIVGVGDSGGEHERGEYSEACAFPRGDSADRRDNACRISEIHRKGFRTGTPLPARHGRGAVGSRRRKKSSPESKNIMRPI